MLHTILRLPTGVFYAVNGAKVELQEAAVRGEYRRASHQNPRNGNLSERPVEKLTGLADPRHTEGLRYAATLGV